MVLVRVVNMVVHASTSTWYRSWHRYKWHSGYWYRVVKLVLMVQYLQVAGTGTSGIDQTLAAGTGSEHGTGVHASTSTLGGTGAGTGTSGIDQTLAAGYAGTGLSQRSSGTDGTGAGTGTSGIGGAGMLVGSEHGTVVGYRPLWLLVL